MKKFLSIFVALAMVLSLFAGVGARTAKAALIDTTAIAGVAVPVTGGAPTLTIPATIEYTATIAWTGTLATGGVFAADTAYTAVITLVGVTPYTLPADGYLFTVAGADTTTTPFVQSTGKVTAIFPKTALTPIAAAAITGVTVPAIGDTPDTSVADGTGYTAATVWSPTATTFAASTVYTAAITLTPATGYALPADGTLFTVAGADTTTHPFVHSTGVVTAIFPATAANALAPAGTFTLFTATAVSASHVLLSWTYSGTDATFFKISRDQIGSTPPLSTAYLGSTIATSGVHAYTYSDTTTDASEPYYYWVGACNALGMGTYTLLPASVFTPAAPVVAPVVPVGPVTPGTLTLTPAGNFVGGVDGSGVAAVDALGTVESITDATHAVVNVTTMGAGSFDLADGIAVLRDSGVTTVDTDWALPGYQWITLVGGTFAVGTKLTVTASATDGVGKVISTSGALAYVNVTTAAVGIIAGSGYGHIMTSPTFAGVSSDPLWTTTTGSQTILFTTTAGLALNDLLDVSMLQAVPAVSATAFLMVGGTPAVGDVATVTWQDTAAASHTVSYTAVTGDTSAKVATALSQLINALDVTTGNVNAAATGSVVQLWQDVAGVAGNGKTLTATTTAVVVPTLTIHTLGGLNSPAYVELGKTIKLVAVDATGAVVSCTWTSVGSAAPAGPSAVVNATGLVTADLALTGVTVVTAKSGTAIGVFAVVVIPVQTITSLKINLVPAVPVSTTVQQFGAIASNAAYSALDYTTQAVWTDALPVASIVATTGLLTYSTDETGNVNAYAGGITATANVKIATGVVTLVPVVGPVTKVIVLTIGSDIVTVDDKATTVDAAPEIVNGRTFVPIRFIAETFGSTVTWLPETKGVTIVLGDTTIGLQIGNATAVINANIIALDAAPYIKNSRTMVPLRVISESFGGNVAWDPINHIITITYVLPVVPPVA